MRHAITRNGLLTLWLAGAMLPATVGAVGVPSPANSTVPSCISLVGTDGTVPSLAFGEFAVFFRDLANNPVPNVLVEVDFSGIPELFIAAAQLDTSMLVDCAGKKVSKRTDVIGRAVFCIVGASTDAFPPVVQLNGCRIYGNGVLLGSPTASAFDLDGQLGLGSGDLVQFLNDYVTGIPYGRSDFDCSGGIGAGDLKIWLTAFGSGSQIVSAATACP